MLFYIILPLGGRLANSVTKQTSILVVASEAEESGSSSIKAAKAKELGVEVWNEQRWVDLVKNYI